MKKVLSLILIAIVLFSMVSCSTFTENPTLMSKYKGSKYTGICYSENSDSEWTIHFTYEFLKDTVKEHIEYDKLIRGEHYTSSDDKTWNYTTVSKGESDYVVIYEGDDYNDANNVRARMRIDKSGSTDCLIIENDPSKTLGRRMEEDTYIAFFVDTRIIKFKKVS